MSSWKARRIKGVANVRRGEASNVPYRYLDLPERIENGRVVSPGKESRTASIGAEGMKLRARQELHPLERPKIYMPP